MRIALLTNHERCVAVAGVLLGLCVSAALAPKNSFFFPNMAYFWGSQLAVLALTLPLKPRPAIIAGVSVALAVYLGAFGAWLFSRTHPESMAWLGYLCSLPGAALGALIATFSLRSRTAMNTLVIGLVAMSAVLLGAFLNQAVVCSTVMYCGGK